MAKIKIKRQKDGTPGGMSTNPEDLSGGIKKFSCDRKIAGRGDIVNFQVDAYSGADAVVAVTELAYATAWNRGVFPDQQHRKAPAQWALLATAGV